MGALVPKTIRTYRWPGNPAPRIYEVPGRLAHCRRHTLQQLGSFHRARCSDPEIAEPSDHSKCHRRTEDEYVDIVARCSDLGIFCRHRIEPLVPQHQAGRASISATTPRHRFAWCAARAPIRRCRSSPNWLRDYSSLVRVAKSVEAAGADAISLINRAARDVHRLSNGEADHRQQDRIAVGACHQADGGCTWFWEVYRAVTIPIFGMGGVASYRDVIEFMAAGARSVRLRHGQLCGSDGADPRAR